MLSPVVIKYCVCPSSCCSCALLQLGLLEGRKVYKQRRIVKNCEWLYRWHCKPYFVDTLFLVFLTQYSTFSVKVSSWLSSYKLKIVQELKETDFV